MGGSDGSTVRGLVLNRFLRSIDIRGAGLIVIQGGVVWHDQTGRVAMPTDARGLPAAGIVLANSPNDVIGGPAARDANLISGNAFAGIEAGTADGVIVQGNTIGPALGGHTLLEPLHPTDRYDVQTDAISFAVVGDNEQPGTAQTVGGATPALGNVIAGEVDLADANSVFQGNAVLDSWVVSSADHNTIGGPTAKPGTAPGNDFSAGSELRIFGRARGTVVQGNHFRGGTVSPIWLQGGTQTTIGGAKADLGNTIEDATAPKGFPSDAAGIRIGLRWKTARALRT